MTSVFTKIIKGELPCYKIFEDEYTLSFLSIEPIQPGHTLVIPKIEVDKFYDVPEPYYSKVFENAVPLARAIEKATGCRRVGTMIQGFEVPHFHYHLVPLFDASDLSFSKARSRSKEDMLAVLQKIQQYLEI